MIFHGLNESKIRLFQDTIGAGDSFIAGFMFSFLRGDSVKESVKTAVSEEIYESKQGRSLPFYFHNLLSSANKQNQ